MSAFRPDALRSAPETTPAGQAAPTSRQPCDASCRYAHLLADPAYTPDWLWCLHPARANRLMHAGTDCTRYQPAAHRFDHAG